MQVSRLEGTRVDYSSFLDSSGQPPTFSVQTACRARNSLDLDAPWAPWDLLSLLLLGSPPLCALAPAHPLDSSRVSASNCPLDSSLRMTHSTSNVPCPKLSSSHHPQICSPHSVTWGVSLGPPSHSSHPSPGPVPSASERFSSPCLPVHSSFPTLVQATVISHPENWKGSQPGSLPSTHHTALEWASMRLLQLKTFTRLSICLAWFPRPSLTASYILTGLIFPQGLLFSSYCLVHKDLSQEPSWRFFSHEISE